MPCLGYGVLLPLVHHWLLDAHTRALARAFVLLSLSQPFTKEALAQGKIGSAVKKHLHKRREELRMYNILDNHEEQVCACGRTCR